MGGGTLQAVQCRGVRHIASLDQLVLCAASALLAGNAAAAKIAERNSLQAGDLRACLAIKWDKKGDSDNFPIMVARNNVNRPSHAHGSRPEP